MARNFSGGVRDGKKGMQLKTYGIFPENFRTVFAPFGFLRTRDISHHEINPQRKRIIDQTWISSEKNLRHKLILSICASFQRIAYVLICLQGADLRWHVLERVAPKMCMWNTAKGISIVIYAGSPRSGLFLLYLASMRAESCQRGGNKEGCYYIFLFLIILPWPLINTPLKLHFNTSFPFLEWTSIWSAFQSR